MSCICIGGVCIPYSALLPCLLIGLQWIAAQFAKVGLLPDFIAKRLGLLNNGNKATSKGASCDGGCCGNSKQPNGKKSSMAERSDSVATTATSSTTTGEEVEVEHIDNLERWQEIFTSSKQSTVLFVKFTADWCKPCKAIQPVYISIASKYNTTATKFTTLDIDGDDCDVLSSKLKVAMMPTFVCFKNGKEIGRMSGGNSGEKLNDWVASMMSN